MKRARFLLPTLLLLIALTSGCKLRAAPPAATTSTSPTDAYIQGVPAPTFAFPTPAAGQPAGLDGSGNESPAQTTNSADNPDAGQPAIPTPTNLEPAAEVVIPTPAAPVSDASAASYIDDRSTPAQLIVSYYNAINRKEYLRAYSYWRDPAESLGDLETFTNNHTDMVLSELSFGALEAGAGAGQLYYRVPVVMETTDTLAGYAIKTSACYVVHQSQPSFFGAPPFQPMSIVSNAEVQVPAGISKASALADACTGSQGGGMAAAAEGETLDISSANYLDNRSGPLETISSFLNALNLKQYVRAYSYMDNPDLFPGDYNTFEAGYAETDVVTATFGAAISEGAMGSLYYKQPLGMQVLTASGTMQYFVGCYNLRLGQPSVQGTPPFRPLGITGGSFKKVVDRDAIIASLPNACK